MKAYDLLFFVDPAIDAETRAATLKRIEVVMSENKAVVDNVDNWGKRRLAYEIDGLTDGDYTLIEFHADPQAIEEIERILRITDAIKRHMITRKED